MTSSRRIKPCVRPGWRVCFLPILLLLLTACASDPSWMYVWADTSEAQRRADFAACQEQTKHLAWVSTAAAVANHACMTKLGYQQVQWAR